jgi:hypothetical protein
MLPVTDPTAPPPLEAEVLPSRWWRRWAVDVTTSMWYRAAVTVTIVLILVLAVAGGLIRIAEVIL